jgi:hypothetical protein
VRGHLPFELRERVEERHAPLLHAEDGVRELAWPDPAGAEELVEVLDGGDAVTNLAAGDREGLREAQAVGETSYPAKK